MHQKLNHLDSNKAASFVTIMVMADRTRSSVLQ